MAVIEKVLRRLMVPDYEIADAETLRRRRWLADCVRNDLAAAGLTIANADLDTDFWIGVVVEVDEGNDAGGGVWVGWYKHPRLRSALREFVATRRHEAEAEHDPIVKYANTITQAMCDAMLAILTSVGYSVVPSDDDMRPGTIKVVSGPANRLHSSPPWWR